MHEIVKRLSVGNGAIKHAQPSKSSDQGRILDDQDFDPNRKRFHVLILSDPCVIPCSLSCCCVLTESSFYILDCVCTISI